MKTLSGLIEAGEPLIQQAIDALRRYHEAQEAGRLANEVERLRLEAESFYRAVTDHQSEPWEARPGSCIEVVR